MTTTTDPQVEAEADAEAPPAARPHEPGETSDAGAATRPRRGMRGPERAWFLAVVAAGLALRVALAWSVGGPIMSDDGMGYLANARWLAGVSSPDLQGAHYYSVGYSFLVAPLYALGLEPADVIRGTQLLNAVLATLVVVPLGALVRRGWPALGGRSWWVALVATSAPALVLQPAIEWPETWLPLLFACWGLLAFRLAQRAGPVDAVLLAVVGVVLYATHERTLGVLPVTALVVLVGAVPRWRRPWQLLEHLAALGVLAAGVVGVRLLTDAQVGALWGARPPQNAGRAGDMLDRVLSGEWQPILAGAVGQTWYLAASSVGLVLLGLLVATGRSWPLLRRPHRGGVRDGLPWAALVAASGIVLATGVVFTAGTRVDHAVYGRYNELWAPTLLAVGLGWLVQQRRRGPLVVGLAAPVVLIGLGVALPALLPPGRLAGDLLPLNILGVMGPQALARGELGETFTELDVVPISVLVGVLGLVVAVSRRAGAAALLTVTGLVLTSFAGAAHLGPVEPFRRLWYGEYRVIVDAVEDADVPDDEPISYDLRHSQQQARKMLQFWLGDDRLRYVDDVDQPGTSLVISGDETLAERCYERVVVQHTGGLQLWERVPGCTP